MTSVPARDRVLDAFESILISQGERAATLEATATEAGVSKGGLLYHFGSKDALVEGLLARLVELVDVDVERIRTAETGPIDYFLRSSLNLESDLDRAIIATTRLAQGSHPQARDALKAMQVAWFDVIVEVVGDRALARTIMLIGDGLYYNSALLPGGLGELDPKSDDMDEVIALVNTLVAARARA
ncbi:TetR family transcriptional regulator [Subtercola boreus]|uniref:TetR family transcriptional regulator n=1 Tax=Subtercola boreus TaxID=120213 RepID=A0A3E0VG22_9MICO|nr:TetR/AcrR family transcriptional regulator [Subtercola boreus]RFA08493.1 TetR family transcriptional regulator [Subtercola boreus]TQL54584.1 TetR family transcriptional regulator [Subtercola boreus]